MEIRILGPFEVRDGDRVVRLPRHKQRALVACLALRAREPVSPDRLVADLWGSSPPATSRQSLQNVVSAIRQILGPGLLLTRPGGYVLDVEPDAVDALRFERLVEVARGLPAGDRAETLRRSLALWRGRAFADLGLEPFAQTEGARLDERRTDAGEDLVDAELELGLHAGLVPRIEALVVQNPLRERPRGQLMLALYRSGRQAEALEAYRELRRVFAEELGIEPGPELRALEHAILRHDDALLPAAAERPAVSDARRLATVLYAEAAGVLDELRAAAEYHGGTVQLAAGDELVAVFAGHEDDAVRAARAALQMRRAVAVELRVGISTGWSDGAAAARRLAANAPAGGIVLDAATIEAAGDAVTTTGQNELTDVRDGPRSAGDAPLVGRERELAQLVAAFDRACTERVCRLAVVAGEAGLGKSRLASELAARVDALVLVGRCVSYGEGATYLPLREAIVQAVGAEPVSGDELVADRIAELIGPGGGQAATVEAFWAVRRFLEALAEERPVLLVFDDVHWAEATFLDLVEYLEQWSRTAPLLVLCLTRPELLERRPGWIEHSLRLEPLTDAQSSALVEELAAELPGATRARVVELAEGNPLYAEQLVARAVEDPAALDSVPPSLKALIASRIDRLDPGQRAVLERASVVGREFWHGAVLKLSDELEVPAVGRHLLELVRTGLIRPGRPVFPREDGFRFHHVLIRDVVYESVPAELRATLHEGVADWLDAQAPAEDELVGFHLEQAHESRVTSGADDGKARRLAADAGDRLANAGMRAWKRGDAQSAAGLLERAAALLPPAEAVRRDVHIELAITFAVTGRPDQAQACVRESFEQAVRAGDRRAEARARVELAVFRQLNAELDDHEGWDEQVLDAVADAVPVLAQAGDDRALARAWGAVTHVRFVRCQYEAAETAARESHESELRSGWPPGSSLSLLCSAFYYGPTPVDQGIAACESLLEGADLFGKGAILRTLSGLETMRGRFDVGRSLLARSLELHKDLRPTRAHTWWAETTGVNELVAGEPAAAESALRQSCTDLREEGDIINLVEQSFLLGEALYRQGRYAEASEWADVSRGVTVEFDVSAQFQSRCLRAKLLARSGALAEAEALAREAAAIAAPTDVLSQQGDVLLGLAEVLHLAGKPEEAARSAAEAIELYERKGNIVSAAHARRLLAELAPV